MSKIDIHVLEAPISQNELAEWIFGVWSAFGIQEGDIILDDTRVTLHIRKEWELTWDILTFLRNFKLDSTVNWWSSQKYEDLIRYLGGVESHWTLYGSWDAAFFFQRILGMVIPNIYRISSKKKIYVDNNHVEIIESNAWNIIADINTQIHGII